MLGPDSFRGDDMHETMELTRLAVGLGVHHNDGKTAAARARVSAGVFISRGEGCRGERREGGPVAGTPNTGSVPRGRHQAAWTARGAWRQRRGASAVPVGDGNLPQSPLAEI